MLQRLNEFAQHLQQSHHCGIETVVGDLAAVFVRAAIAPLWD
jgi:hypothetical protein